MFTGPFTFLPGESTRIAVLMVFAKPSVSPEADGSMPDLADLVNKVKFARKYYYDPTTSDVKTVRDEIGFSISPNPATDYIEISVGENGRSPLQNDVRIYDVFGQRVNPTPTPPASRDGERLDVSGLAPGVYFVRIGDKVSKFVKL
jgi:hypothetical protein